jgi:hypothetical protein
MIVALLIEFGGLLLILITVAWLLGRRFDDRINRARIMAGALIVFFLTVLGFFGYLVFVLNRTSSIWIRSAHPSRFPYSVSTLRRPRRLQAIPAASGMLTSELQALRGGIYNPIGSSEYMG